MNTSILRRLWVTISTYVVGFYASVLNRFEIVGAENIPREGGVLLASNHISGYETVFLPWAVTRSQPLEMIWAPAKEELFKNPFLGFFFRSWGAFPVRRGRDVRAGKVINDLLKTDKVMLFPEGTRNKDGQLGKGNRGVGKLIYDTRPVVIPVALSGLNRWKFPGFGQPARVVFGPALDFSDLYRQEDDKQTHLQIVERVMTAIAGQLEDN
ncbi:1-acyl-sn-glycerol-3-phosphate acyltransferase [Desulfuromonas versatilis]|uniref:1-acyl-sn-glycerol-3-phosphate acyltransferase n=1 Tax=Desulfuromonas versatilis TaxID=2802975 RepID=A0ABN6DYD9_9BACT|nr:lysophospholipid acyltransferase family protein [Desulfuromonas versatilis]BCR05070.1 1-acyl-sn-glycerol-3-phosphate acyltransferase [Desulfuromonas versatilis]